MGRYGEMWRDMGRYGEVWGDFPISARISPHLQVKPLQVQGVSQLWQQCMAKNRELLSPLTTPHPTSATPGVRVRVHPSELLTLGTSGHERRYPYPYLYAYPYP